MEKSEANKRFDKQFGVYIKKLRFQRGWTQEQLADRIGNNFQNVSGMERGEISPTLFWCTKIAAAFDVKLLDFIKGIEFRK